MASRIVHRPARRTPAPGVQQQRVIEVAPSLGGAGGGGGGGALQMLLPMVGSIGSVAMMTMGRSGPMVMVGVGLLALTMVGSIGGMIASRGKGGKDRKQQRTRYLDYLERMRDDFSKEERKARAQALELNPPPDALLDCVVDVSRLWERRRTDSDFLQPRCGSGRVPVVPATVGQGGSAMEPPDQFMMAEANALVRRFTLMPDMPLTVPLDHVGNVSIIGDREGVVRVARSLLVQTAVFHAPEDVILAAAYPRAALPDWQWLSWLPHVQDPERADGPTPFRRIADTPQKLSQLLSDDLSERVQWATESRRGSVSFEDRRKLTQRILVLHDTYGDVAAEVRPQADDSLVPGELGVTVLHLVADRVQEPSSVTMRITVYGDDVRIEDLRGQYPMVASGQVDHLDAAVAEGVARELAPLRLSAESLEEDAQLDDVDFMGLIGIGDVAELDFNQLWKPRSDRQFLRVPLGVDDSGAVVLVDLKESAQLGMGPHGLCIGATGSGKSEVLRTMVLALLATHSPEDLALVLVDFKGGASFAPFAGVPHVAGIITNLRDDASLIERAYKSLEGEVLRRQQVLKDAGNIANITDYRLHRDQNPDLPALPHLFVIIDEFGELLNERPDFIDLFLSIGRIGRSIGVHLLLSSQRIESGKLRGLETYLSYRLGLRTFSEEESRTVLDTTDAFHLPPLPGFGFLKVDTSVYQRFRAAYISGPYVPPADEVVEVEGEYVRPHELTPYQQSEAELEARKPVEEKATERTTGPTVLNVFVDQVRRTAQPVLKIWLPPLPAACTLDGLAGRADYVDGRGLQLAVRSPQMCPPVGVVDDPANQRQEVFRLDLTRAGGHAAIVGGPQSGKTTALRTLVTSLAHTHTPQEVAIYALDLAGGGMQALAELPHVGGVALRTDRERIRRTVEEIRGMIDQRERVFRNHAIDTMEALRADHAAGSLPELPTADVVLVIDNFGAIRTTFDELDEPITDILQRGSSYGVHVVTAMMRWNDIRMQNQSMFGTMLELRLNDPSDSNIDRRLQEVLRKAGPGRMLIPGSKLYAQFALPRIDGAADDTNLTDVLEAQAVAARSTWQGPRAPQIRILPLQLPRNQVADEVRQPAVVPIGVDERALAPVYLDLAGRDTNLVVFGDSGSGKTNIVRLVVQQLLDQHTSDQLVFAVMDPRRGLREFVPEAYVGGYAPTGRVAAGLANGVSEELAKRMPDDTGAIPEAGQGGPRIVVLADDYDLLTSGGQSPMDAFLPYVASGRDIKLHFIVTRRASGASRQMYEPFMSAVLESGAAGLVLSGDRSEGQLFTGAYPGDYPPGRGLFVRRGDGAELVQTAMADPAPAVAQSSGGTT
ncbi:type VII secretion protein EccCa [Kribbella capetownensis]|uniref:Type VII secretion protein EccCa n=1 Tax=Kribbella capetownensis TaxID=1572659 RepID=A0A4R0JMH3_9ACTN|nr:type VII secretion protein EccCa [Kribbella capetownensis]TCC47879.1 type VII secretion protein EccCa [Kribbella capetownensis]